ncbi:hypothetical protein Ddye_020265 [Dipteronia dyeriana]|uniref:MULE transposase domain-containing protein n=1 Tax=Dipteronia dyeriana TaxID=168575 RepID=A0AAD9U0G8_9ROSI|nr:hypothetical protein Ddye_020265 [Dipteronia dyeriana]
MAFQMDPHSYFGSMSKSNFDLDQREPLAWDNTNTVYKNYHYGSSSYNMNDLEDEIDHPLFTDQIVSTTPVSTSNISNLPKLTKLDESGQFRSLQPTDVIGKEFGSVEDAESFYSNYSKAVWFSTKKDEMRHDSQDVITRRMWVCSKQGVCYSTYSRFGVTKSHSVPTITSKFQRLRYCTITVVTLSWCEDRSKFFFEYTLDENDRFGNLFWADSTSRSNYGYFGDVLAFDATYKTNVYRRPLVMLVGVNHHKSTTIFDFGLPGDETVEIYTWLLRTFLDSMHGKMPQSVVSDGKKAMHKAIKTVMPNSVRRLCCWHLELNVQTNIQDGNFTRAFCSSMLTYMTVEDFELKWKNMAVKFRLNNNEWVNALYSKRKLWVETFLRQFFWWDAKHITLRKYEFIP